MTQQVFLSYSRRDSEDARHIQMALHAHGIVCSMDTDIHASQAYDRQIADVITKSHMLLVLVTSNAECKPDEIKREVLIANHFNIPVLPIFLISSDDSPEFRYLFSTANHFRAVPPPALTEHLEKLATQVRLALDHYAYQQLTRGNAKSDTKPSTPAVAPPPEPVVPAAPVPAARRVALLYKRHAAIDQKLVQFLEQNLAANKFEVFCDRHLKIGTEWLQTIERKIKDSDAVIPLISGSSLNSEMLAMELTIAHEARSLSKHNPPRPQILPVRVQYEGNLTGELGASLDRLQYFLWQSEADNQRLLDELLQALNGTMPKVDASKIEMPGGVVSIDSPLYVERQSDSVFAGALERRDSILLVKGARQMGKTSLIARRLNQARKAGHTVAITDLQRLNTADLADPRRFYSGLSEMLIEQLDLDDSLDNIWREGRAPNLNFQRFIKTSVLQKLPGRLIWAIDEADRLFSSPFGTEVFGLFRSWHNARGLDPQGPWQQLSLVISYATEAALFIKDVNMSPFNVGTQITLQDFSEAEISVLNDRHGRPLRGPEEISELYKLVGGQPFLVRRSLYAVAIEGLRFEDLKKSAARDEGLFGDHLRRFLVLLHRDQELEGAVRRLLASTSNDFTQDQFYRLRSAGLLRGEARQEAQPRCAIYEEYFKRHL